MKAKANPFVRNLISTAIITLGATSAHAAPYTWDGGTNTWNSTNWNSGAAAGPTASTDNATINGGQVTINSQTINSAIALNGGTLVANAQGGVANVTLNGNLTGSGTLNKIGDWSLLLGGDNSGFSGTINTNVANILFMADSAGSAAADWVLSTGTNVVNKMSGTGHTIKLGSLAGTGGSLGGGDASGAAATFEIGGNGKSTTFAGQIMNTPSGWGGGTASLTKVGSGTLTLTGTNTYTGTTTLNGGILSANTVADSTGSSIGLGTSLVFGSSGGTLQFTGTSGSTTRAITFNGGGTFDVTGTSSLTVGTTTGSPTTTNGKWSGGAGVIKTGAGTLVVRNNGDSAAGARFVIDGNYGGNFTMQQGTLTISPTSYMTIGDSNQSSATATYTQTGGTTTYTAADGLYIGNWGNGSGNTANLTITGGSFTQNSGTTYVGRGNGSATSTTGNLTVGGGGGTASFTAPTLSIANGGNTGNVTISSNGTLVTSSIVDNGGTSNLYFDGGTLQVSSSFTSGNTLLSNVLDSAQIKNAGAIIDTNGKDATIAQVLANYSGNTGGLTKSGTGALTLSGTNTYTGTTKVNAGSLVLDNNSAAGTGGIALSGASASVKITATTLVGNNITVSDKTASVIRNVGASAAYNVGTTGALKSSFTDISNDRPDTTAKILAGTNSSTAANLTMSFSNESSATNDGIRRSDVFTLSSSQTFDAFVLQLTAATPATDSVLGWENGSNVWEYAVTSNTGTAGLLAGSYNVSYDTFLANHGGSFNPATMLGAYGVDTSGSNVTVWAVVNHGGSFTAVPEPTGALVGLLVGAGMLRRRRTA